MAGLILFHLLFGAVGLMVLLVVGLLYRGRRLRHAERLTDVVVAVADRVDPGEAPPEGVLSSPDKARVMARRFELAERRVRSAVRHLLQVVGVGRDPGRHGVHSSLHAR